MNPLAILAIVKELAPLVALAVNTAEMVFGAGHGTEKLKHATQAVEETLPKVEALARNLEAARAAVGPMIEATVGAMNAVGQLTTPQRAKPAKRVEKKRRKG